MVILRKTRIAKREKAHNFVASRGGGAGIARQPYVVIPICMEIEHSLAMFFFREHRDIITTVGHAESFQAHL